MKSVCALAQKIRGASAHDHAISSVSDFLHHLLTHGHEAVSVKWLRAGKRDALLMAAPPKHFDQTLKCAIDAFFAALDSRTFHVGNLGDLFRQSGVPELPAEALGKFAGNLAASASVFAFDGNDAIHQISPLN